MNTWIVPDEADLAGTLSQREIDAFRASPATQDSLDPVRQLLDQAAAEVRGACRSNGRVRLDTERQNSVPRSTLRALVAIVAFDVLKRLPVPVGEDRRTAYRDALALLEKISSGSFTPESAEERGEETAACPSPRASEPHQPPRLLD